MLGRAKLNNTLLTCKKGNFSRPESNPSHSGARHLHYHCATSTSTPLQKTKSLQNRTRKSTNWELVVQEKWIIAVFVIEFNNYVVWKWKPLKSLVSKFPCASRTGDSSFNQPLCSHWWKTLKCNSFIVHEFHLICSTSR